MPPSNETVEDVVKRIVEGGKLPEQMPPDARRELVDRLMSLGAGRGGRLGAIAMSLMQSLDGLTLESPAVEFGGWQGSAHGFVPWQGQPDMTVALSRGGPTGELRLEAGRDPYSGFRAGVSGSMRDISRLFRKH